MLAKAPRGRDGKYRAHGQPAASGQAGRARSSITARAATIPTTWSPHEHRRDLRGLRTFCAWLGHDDSKALNTLDMLAKEDGTPLHQALPDRFRRVARQRQLHGQQPARRQRVPVRLEVLGGQFFTLGLYAPKWQRAKYPNLPAAGPLRIRDLRSADAGCRDYPNAAFRNENPADRAWAARKIAAFTDEEIRAIVATGRYTDPAAEEWVARCLIERRNKIVDAFLTGTAALDRFEVAAGPAGMGVRRPATAAAPVQVQWSVFDNETGEPRGCWPAKRRRKCRDVAEDAGIPGGRTQRRAGSGGFGLRQERLPIVKFVIGVERSFPNRKAN